MVDSDSKKTRIKTCPPGEPPEVAGGDPCGVGAEAVRCWAQGWLGEATQPREPTTLTGNVAEREEECSPESKTLHVLPTGHTRF